MKHQPFATARRVVLGLFFLGAFVARPAWSATCTSANLPTGPTAYVATGPNLVTVIDASTNTVACTIAVGSTATSSPIDLAVSPDGSQLFVENDNEASVSVIDLSTGAVTNVSLTTSGVTPPMIANLKVSPDGTFVYVVVLPATVVPGTSKPSLLKMATTPPFTVTPATNFNGSASLTPVTAAGLDIGIAFLPDATKALIATEGNTYVVQTSDSSILSVVSPSPVNGGTAAEDPNGNFTYIVDTAAGANTVSKIPTGGAATALHPSNTPPSQTCTTSAAAVALTPDGKFAYYSCQGDIFVQKIDTATNSVAATILGTFFPAGAAPFGVAVTSDGASVYVANGNSSSISVFSVAADNQTALIAGLGALGDTLGGIAFRPVQLSISPTTQSVATGATFQFTDTLKFAFGGVTWSVKCTAGAPACGTVDATTGKYTAPSVIPSPNDVKVIATSTEIPVGSLKYPMQSVSAAVTITASQLVVSGPASVTAGSANNITVTAEDSLGNVVTGYTGTVHFTSSDSQAVLPADYTFVAADSGTHTFSVTLKTAGSQTIAATDTATATITGTSSSITVSSVGASKLLVSAPASVTAGSANNITVTAEDSFGNVVTGYTDTVHFTSTDGQAVLPADYTFVAADSGTHTFSVTLKTVGSQTITATDTVTTTITGTSGSITVSSVGASKLVVSGPASVTAGSANNITVTAEDSFGNVVTGYTDTVHFTSTDGQAVLPADYTFVAGDSGTHAFSVTLKTAGTQTVTATDTATTTITGTSGSITVNPAAASNLVVSAPASVTAGIAGNVTVTAKDVFGNTATGYAGTVRFTSSDPQATLPANSTLASGTGVFSVTFKTAGTQTITAADTVTVAITGTSGGITVNPAPASALVVVGYASPVVAGTANNFTVTAKDQFGNIVTGYTGTVHFTSSDGQAVLPVNYTFVPGDNGGHTFSATLRTAGSQSITATDTVTATTTGTQAGIAVSAAGASKLVFTIEPANGAAGTAIPNSQVSVEDAFGNLVTSGAGSNASLNITPASVPTGAAGTGVATTFTASGGVATISGLTFTQANIPPPPGSTTVAAYSYTLVAASSGLTSANSNSFTISPAAANKLVYTTEPANGTAGVALGSVILAFEDTFGNVASSNAAVSITSAATPGAPAAASVSGTTNVPAANGIAAFNNLILKQVGTDPLAATKYNYTLTATSGALTVGSTPTITLVPGIAKQLAFNTQPVSGTTAGTALSSSVVVYVEDSTGANVVTSDTSTVTMAASAVTPTAGKAFFTSDSTTSVAASGGVATFSNLKPDRSATLTLSASDGLLTSATSSNFTVMGDPGAIPTGAAGSSMATPVGLSSLTPSASATVNLLGPAPADGVTFTIACGSLTLTNLTCATTPTTSTMGTDGGLTPIMVTLTGSFAAVPRTEPDHRIFPALRAERVVWRVLAPLGMVCLVGFVSLWLLGFRKRRLWPGFALILLCCLAVGWMSACTQFSQPAFPNAPVGHTQPGAGTVTLTITPSGAGPGADNYTQQQVTVFISVQ